MGCFGSKRTRPQTSSLPPLTAFPIAEYPRRVILSMWNDGRSEKLSLALSEPDACVSKVIKVANQDLRVSCERYTDCVLPGLDPMGEEKLCQDLTFYEIREGLLLMSVCDGHGPWGHRVVRYCQRASACFLDAHIEDAKRDPTAFLKALCADCHTALEDSSSGVNCNLSGTTAVFALLSDGRVHIASVGDSRAVLGSTRLPDLPYIQQPVRDEDKPLIDHISAMREEACPETDIRAIQLTKDQKPDDPAEAQRITACGGVIKRSKDDDGQEGGPFRVWKPDHGYPGIAMARSLGDIIAHGLGLSAEPEVTTVNLMTDDKFIVLASDGLWDVMDNEEVCDFLEAHRRHAVSYQEEPQLQEVVTLQSAPVAHLLCEEARTRWLSVAEAEDVVIDDISCIVLELDNIHAWEPTKSPQRFSLRQNRRRSSGGKTPESPLTPDTGMFLRRDERRASILGHFVQ